MLITLTFLAVWLLCGVLAAAICGIRHYRRFKRLTVEDIGLLSTVVLAGPIILVCLPVWWIQQNRNKIVIDRNGR